MAEQFDPQTLQILLHVEETQHEQSLAHRQSIFNAFSLGTAGLAALLAGAIAPGQMSQGLKYPVISAVIVTCLFVIVYIHQQRDSSERAMGIVRDIDQKLRLFSEGTYLGKKAVLPGSYTWTQPNLCGFSWRIDVWLVLALVLLGAAIIFAILALPIPTCEIPS